MTDARVPDRWLYEPEFDLLSDRAHRTFIGALQWCNGQGTDGRIPPSALRFLHPLGVDITTADELIAAGKWESIGEGSYQVVDWAVTQSLAADVIRMREQNRARVAAWRAKRPPVTDNETHDVTHYETGDVTDDVMRVSRRQGTGTGKAHLEVELNNAGTSDPAESEAAPDQLRGAATGCIECQRGAGFGSGPCPLHRPAA